MLNNILNGLIVLYLSFLNNYNINYYVKRLFKNAIFKILFLFLIILIFDSYLITSILLSIMYVITLDYIYTNDNLLLIQNVKKYKKLLV